MQMTMRTTTADSGRNAIARYPQVSYHQTIPDGHLRHSADIVGDLYEKYSRLVHRRALRFFPENEAEEVTHEVFIQVMEKIDTFRAEASPATWLYRITTNHCLNRLRNLGRRRELWRERAVDILPSDTTNPEQEAKVMLRQLWEEIPKDLLQIAVYYHVDGLTHSEIARILGTSRRTVGNRLDELSRLAHNAVERTPGGSK